MKMKSKFYYVSFEMNSDNDNNHIDDKEVEELSLLAYIEAKTKILKQSGGAHIRSNSKNTQELEQKIFVSAAELMMATGNN